MYNPRGLKLQDQGRGKDLGRPAQPPKLLPGKGQAKATWTLQCVPNTPFLWHFAFWLPSTQVPRESPPWQGLTLVGDTSFVLGTIPPRTSSWGTNHREGPLEPRVWNRHSWSSAALQATKHRANS